MLDQHPLVADLEAEIDSLCDSAERCRKIDIVAKAMMGIGVGLLLMGFLWFSASALVIGIAAVLGSVALVGSTRGTLGEIITGIRLAEARRAEVIDSLELETVRPRIIAGSDKTGDDGRAITSWAQSASCERSQRRISSKYAHATAAAAVERILAPACAVKLPRLKSGVASAGVRTQVPGFLVISRVHECLRPSGRGVFGKPTNREQRIRRLRRKSLQHA